VLRFRSVTTHTIITESVTHRLDDDKIPRERNTDTRVLIQKKKTKKLSSGFRCIIEILKVGKSGI
jgi:hypothetical protein